MNRKMENVDNSKAETLRVNSSPLVFLGFVHATPQGVTAQKT